MGESPKERNCNVREESSSVSEAEKRRNDSDNEGKFKTHRYFANKAKGFWEAIKQTFQI